MKRLGPIVGAMLLLGASALARQLPLQVLQWTRIVQHGLMLRGC